MRQITYPKEKKEKYEKYHSDDLFALFKNRTENNNNGPVVGEKTPVTNNDGGNKPPAKVLCCQNPVKTVDLEILNQVDQEHQIPQNLGYAKSERLASIIKKKTGHMKSLAILKNTWKISDPAKLWRNMPP